ncbi:MAG: manganese catalase family protein [Oscillospiraceae bacterium]|nr:manganese catalase family protein [Oscillospiraceae bacterium]
MFQYEKALQYPVKIARPNAKLAKMIMSQLGGPNGELGASMRYLNQRYTMPLRELQGLLTDIGTEELSHMEMVSAVICQLTKGLTPEQLEAQGFADYFVDHTAGIYPVSAAGVPFNAATFQSTGDAITDLNEDLAAEQKARTTYDNILRLADDPDVRDVIRFLREREIVHYQRFGEGLRLIQEQLAKYAPDPENPYAFNTSFDPMPVRPQPRQGAPAGVSLRRK